MTEQPSVFDLLAHRRRRWTIGVLALSPRALSVDALAAYIADFEHQSPTTTETKRIRTSLRHRHLDRLEAGNIVAVTDDVVSRGPAFWPVFRTLTAGLSV